MNFLDCVNRIFRIQGLLRGDTDPVVAFTDTNHASSLQIVQIAVQDELTELMSRGLLPYAHKTTGSITCATSTRTYALASDFTQLWGDDPYFYDASSNFQIRRFPGGEEALRASIYTYRTDPGYPLWWYFEQATTQEVSFYPVPDAPRNGLALTYDYMATVNVSNSTDTLPFTTQDQAYAFTNMAARRFKYLFEGKPDIALEQDNVYKEARSRLFALIKGRKPSPRYGNVYKSSTGWMQA